MVLNNQDVRSLVSAILLQAVTDYKNEQYKEEVTEFLQSNYGKTLCDTVDLNPDWVLKQLENQTK